MASVHTFVVLARDMASRVLRNISQAADRLHRSLSNIPFIGIFFRAGTAITNTAGLIIRAFGRIAVAATHMARSVGTSLATLARHIRNGATRIGTAIRSATTHLRSFVASVRAAGGPLTVLGRHLARTALAVMDAAQSARRLGRRLIDLGAHGRAAVTALHTGMTRVAGSLRGAAQSAAVMGLRLHNLIRSGRTLSTIFRGMRGHLSSLRTHLTSAARSISRWSSGVWSSLQSMVRNVASSLQSLGSAAAMAAANIIPTAIGLTLLAGVVSSLVAIFADLGMVLSLVLVVPAGLSALIAAVGVLKMATGGLSEAWQAAGAAASGSAEDMEAYREAMEKLSPAGRELITVLRGWKPVMDELSKTLQQSVFAGIGHQIDLLAKTYFPIFTTWLPKIGSALNSAMMRISELLRTSESVGIISRVLASTSKAMGILGEAVTHLLDAFLSLADAGAPIFVEIAEWVRDIARGFAEWARQANATGKAQEWMHTGLGMLKKIGSIAWNVVRALGAVAIAASDIGTGQSFLDVLDSKMKSLADWLLSEEGQERLKSFFRGVRHALHDIKELAKGLWDLLSDPESREEIKADLTAIKDAVVAIANAIRLVVNAFDAVQDRINAIREAISTLFDGLSAPDVGSALGIALSAAWNVVAGWMNAIVSTIQSTLGSLPGVAAAALAGLPGAIGVAFATAWNSAFGWTNAIVSTVQSLLASLPGIASAALAGLPDSIGNAFMSAWQRALNNTNWGVSSIIAQTSTVPGRAGSALGPLSGALSFPSLIAWHNVTAIFGYGVRSAAATARSLVGAAAAAIGGLGGTLYSIGYSLMASLASGVRDGAGQVRSALGAVTSAIPSWKGPEDKDRKLLQPAGQAIMSGLVSGIRRGTSGVHDQLSHVTASIPTVAMPSRHTEAAIAAAGSTRSYSITVNVPLGAAASSVGREVVDAITAYERDNGRRWRT